MKKRSLVAFVLLILLTTITLPEKKLVTSKFNIKKINIENNFLIKKNDIKNLLDPIYNKSLIFLNNSEIENLLIQNSFIESFKVKKKYPSTLKIEIFEKKPFAILIYKKKNFT